MAVFIIAAENAIGRRFQFNVIPCDERHARTRAARAAVLLSLFCSPDEWAGGRVVVTEAVGRSLVAVSRIHLRTKSARVEGAHT